jgi:hypothetical protein
MGSSGHSPKLVSMSSAKDVRNAIFSRKCKQKHCQARRVFAFRESALHLDLHTLPVA